MTGIYYFKNKINEKYYIGQSIDIYRRIKAHHMVDYKNKNNSCYNTKFYEALRKYELDNFEIGVIEECSYELLSEREKYWIEYYNSFENGYNSTLGGEILSPNLFTEETENKRQATRELNKTLQGENHPRAKLSNEEVSYLRTKYIEGYGLDELYQNYKEIYPIKSGFANMLRGKSYTKVEPIPTKADLQHRTGKRMLTVEQVRKIRQLKSEGQKRTEIARIMDIPVTTVDGVIYNKTYKHII